MKLKTKGFLSIVLENIGDDALKCTVTDNGRGRKKAQEENQSLSEKDRP